MTDLYCNQVLVALRSITRALDIHYKQLKSACGITGPQLIVLKAILESGELPVGELAKSVTLSPATVTDMLARLEKQGFVSRKPGLSDRRNVLVSITKEGTEVLSKAPPLLHEAFVSQFTRLPEWEQTSMVSVLQRVAQMIGVKSSEGEAVLSIAPIDISPPKDKKQIARPRESAGRKQS